MPGTMKSSHGLNVCKERAFGPTVVSSCRGGFDFTAIFEETILFIGPSTIFVLAACLNIAWLCRKEVKVTSGFRQVLKFITTLVYTVLHLLLLVLSATHRSFISDIYIASSTVGLICALVLCILSPLEHTRSARPSFLITTYLLVSLFLDASRVRTQWLLLETRSICIIQTSSLAVKFILLVLESWSKRSLLIKYSGEAAETTSGIFARAFFWWLNPLLLRGFREMFTIDDLLAIDDRMASCHVFAQIQQRWESCNQKSKHSLLRLSLITFRVPILTIIFPRLCVVGLNLAQPFLISDTIKYIQLSVSTDSAKGYGLIGAFALVYIGVAIFTSWYQHLVIRSGTMVKGALASLLYHKLDQLENGSVSSASAMALMGTDVEQIAEAWNSICDIWAFPIQIGFAIWMLQRQLGIACAIPIILSISASLGSLRLGKFLALRQRVWLDAIKDRVNASSEVLSSIEIIKMLGFTTRMSEMIQGMRSQELDISKRYRHLSVTNNALVNVPPILSPIFTFASYAIISKVKDEGELNVSQAFTSLALLSLINYPVASFIFAIPELYSAIGCFSRIQDFLSRGTRKDFRLVVLSDEIDDFGRGKTSDIELKRIQSSHQYSDHHVVVIKNGCFKWKHNSTPTLQDINLYIQRSSITFIVGPTGSGKSALLKAILGEAKISGGAIEVASKEAAFCDQTSWIRNGTLRENILGYHEYEMDWYATVIHACTLDVDLQTMEKGDYTVVGSKGIALSGGQRQRLALARAVYARKHLVLLDDVFSALDLATAITIFDRLLGPSGVLRQLGSTTILATSDTGNLGQADNLVILTEGRIIQQGKFCSLQSSSQRFHSLEQEIQRAPNAKFEIKPVDRPGSATWLKQVGNTNEGIPQDPYRKTGDFSILVYYLKSMGILRVLIFATLVVLCVSFSALQSLWLSWWSGANESSTQQGLGYWLGIYASLGSIQCISLVAAVGFLYINIVPKSAKDLHLRLLQATMKAPVSFFQFTDHGSLINRFSQGILFPFNDL
jgi:ATP-binding cassette subfamily C (CFTR/MRP) protein 1